jgi:hypothetical protein
MGTFEHFLKIISGSFLRLRKYFALAWSLPNIICEQRVADFETESLHLLNALSAFHFRT